MKGITTPASGAARLEHGSRRDLFRGPDQQYGTDPATANLVAPGLSADGHVFFIASLTLSGVMGIW